MQYQSYCFIGEDMSKSWDSCFIRFQTLADEARSPSFWHITLNTLCFFSCFWTLSCFILRVVIRDLLTFFCWYRGTDCEQKKQYNQTINPLHYRVDVNYESIWYPERLKSLPQWCCSGKCHLLKNCMGPELYVFWLKIDSSYHINGIILSASQ